MWISKMVGGEYKLRINRICFRDSCEKRFLEIEVFFILKMYVYNELRISIGDRKWLWIKGLIILLLYIYICIEVWLCSVVLYFCCSLLVRREVLV